MVSTWEDKVILATEETEEALSRAMGLNIPNSVPPIDPRPSLGEKYYSYLETKLYLDQSLPQKETVKSVIYLAWTFFIQYLQLIFFISEKYKVHCYKSE